MIKPLPKNLRQAQGDSIYARRANRFCAMRSVPRGVAAKRLAFCDRLHKYAYEVIFLVDNNAPRT
jgi:hypothetical protein